MPVMLPALRSEHPELPHVSIWDAKAVYNTGPVLVVRITGAFPIIELEPWLRTALLA
jgi:hypothetical protein